MSKRVGLIVASLILASTCLAQEQMESRTQATENVSAKGVRISIIKPELKADVTLRDDLGSRSGNASIDSSLGFAIGYGNLPIRQVGHTMNFSYITFSEASSKLLRIDGNVAYAFDEKMNVKGGLNISKLDVSPFNAGVGGQVSFGVQFTRNVGLDVGYTVMNQSASSGSASADIKFSGIELALVGTF